MSTATSVKVSKKKSAEKDAHEEAPPAKKPRTGTRPRKNEKPLKDELERYKVEYDGCGSCWQAYKQAMKVVQKQRKEEKQHKEETMPALDKVQALLSQSARHANFANTLEAQGKTAQANGMKKAAANKLSLAKEVAATLSPAEMDQLSDTEKEALQTGDTTKLVGHHGAEKQGANQHDIDKAIEKYAKQMQEKEKHIEKLEEVVVEVASLVTDEHKPHVSATLEQMGLTLKGGEDPKSVGDESGADGEQDEEEQVPAKTVKRSGRAAKASTKH